MKKCVLPLLMLPFLFSGCNYYKIAIDTTPVNELETRIAEGEYLLTISEGQTLYVSEISAEGDSLKFITQEVPTEIVEVYDEAIKVKTKRYIRNKGGKAVLKENRIVFREGVLIEKGENAVAFSDVLQIESIVPNRAKTITIHGLAIISGPVILVGLAAWAMSEASYGPIFHDDMYSPR